MNKKEVLVIVLAFILAIVFANYMMKGTKNIRDTKPNIQVEDSVEDNSEIPIEEEIEVPVNAEETVYDSKSNVTSKKVSDVVQAALERHFDMDSIPLTLRVLKKD